MALRSKKVNDGLPPPSTRRAPAFARDAAATRARILVAAQEVFAYHGYTHGGMRIVADAAGVNVALVAKYFGSKEELFRAALEQMLGGGQSLWDAEPASFGRDVVAGLLDGEGGGPNPLPLLTQAAADPVARGVATELLATRVMQPLAARLGGFDGERRATEILALCAGFFTYRLMLPLGPFSGELSPAARRWFEEGLQRIVDERP